MKKTICFVCISIIVLIILSYGYNERIDKNTMQSAIIDSSEGETKSEYGTYNELDTDQSVKEENIDLSNYFNGINGCAVFYSPEKNQYFYYNMNMCEQRVSPFSTFKIISALLGLENDVIENESSTMKYNGEQYSNVTWNRDLTLKEAFQTSCIWYFRQVVDAVGEEQVQETLNKLHYGNCDISEWEGSKINQHNELNGFWLGSSLEISPVEQTKVLSEIFESQGSFRKSSIEILRNIMLVDQNEMGKIYGKTGSGANGNAWFVGFSEEYDARNYFAVYLSDPEQGVDVSGNTAKEIALKIIKSKENRLTPSRQPANR